jgi:hypothetical protein
LENFLRLQEDWTGVNLYYNGSMCCMFDSRIANAPWPGTGTVYDPPTRIWGWNTNYSNPSALPPLTPAGQVVSNSTPTVLTVTSLSGTVSVSWTAQPGKTYQAQYTTNLVGGKWQNLGQPFATVPFEFKQALINDSITNRATFYRVVALP